MPIKPDVDGCHVRGTRDAASDRHAGIRSTHVVVEKTDQLVESLQRSTLPVEQSGFTLTRFDAKRRAVASELGVHSAEWLYERPKAHAEVACDFPFVGWNELDQSYRAQGWDIIERRIIVLPADKDPAQVPLVQAELRRVDGVPGVLMFSLLDDAGRPLQPPGTAALRQLLVSSDQRPYSTPLDRFWYRTGNLPGTTPVDRRRCRETHGP